MIVFLLLPVFALWANAEDQVVAAITLNTQPKGDFFVIMREDGDFLLRAEDLESIGISASRGDSIQRSGERYVSLRSVLRLQYEFDESTLTIHLVADPEILPSTSLDLSPVRKREVYYPTDSSYFLNYGLNHETAGENLNFARFSLSNEIGIRVQNILFLSNSIYSETPDNTEFIRLNSSFTYDQRDMERRFIAGDFFASSGGSLGSQVNMAGLSFRKIYRMNPYFIRYPLLDFRGQLPLPADVSIYRDGVEVQSERFNPGEFSLENFQGSTGAQMVEIVIRDSLGREERIQVPFYFSDDLLRQGLHEYSYNLGVIRQEFGVASNRYSQLAFSGFHRYGFNDYINLGWRGEASQEVLNLGAESIMKLGAFGLLHLEASASRSGAETGVAGLVAYEYQTRRFRSSLSLQTFSQSYATLATKNLESDRGRLNFRAGLGYTTPRWGSFSVDYTRTEYAEVADRNIASFSWSQKLWKRSYLQATLRHVEERSTSEEGWINLTWYFGTDQSLTARYERQNMVDTQSVEVRKSTPIGQGTGWEFKTGRSSVESEDEYLVDAFVQHNAHKAILRSDYSQNIDAAISQKSLRLSVSGALVHLGGTTLLTRPVRDSFSLVTVGDAENVRVAVNGQLVGRTNRNGQAIVPEMSSYYENRVSFEDTDIPLDYLMPQVGLNVSPPLRSGSCINFPLKRYQAFTGYLIIDTDKGQTPLINARLTLKSSSGPVTFWTGGEGEFYLDSQMADFDILSVQGCDAAQNDMTSFLPAGTYPIMVRQGSQTFETEITIPASDEIFTELGMITLPVLAGNAPSTNQPTDSKPENPAVEPEVSTLEQNQPGEPAGEPLRPEEPEQEKTPSDQTNMTSSLPPFTIHFPLDSSIPLPSEQPVLDQAVRYLHDHPDLPIEIEGHTDQSGSSAYNQQLGYLRAQAIRKYLETAGINPQRFSRIVSYGESKPQCLDIGEDCLRQNRRAIVLMAITAEN